VILINVPIQQTLNMPGNMPGNMSGVGNFLAGGYDSDDIFSIPLHINYEDTDAGGVVYYGNYPGYMERVRNAFLRTLGFPPGQLVENHQMLFVVTEVAIKYIAAAKLDDALIITLQVTKMRGAEIVFHHRVLREGGGGETVCLVEADISLAILNSETFKPRRVPGFLIDSIACKEA